MHSLVLTVIQSVDPSLSVGFSVDVPATGGVIGRTSDILLPGSTVSRQHAHLKKAAHGWTITAITETNAVFFNTERLTLHQPYELKLDQPVQIGGVVCVLQLQQGTLPVLTPLHSKPCLLTAQDDGGQFTIYAQKTLLSMAPQTSAVLSALMSRAHEPIHRWDLLELIGANGNLHKVISNLRACFVQALGTGTLNRALLTEQLQKCQSKPVNNLDDTQLVRLLIQTKRGHGYILNLSAEAVRVVLV